MLVLKQCPEKKNLQEISNRQNFLYNKAKQDNFIAQIPVVQVIRDQYAIQKTNFLLHFATFNLPTLWV